MMAEKRDKVVFSVVELENEGEKQNGDARMKNRWISITILLVLLPALAIGETNTTAAQGTDVVPVEAAAIAAQAYVETMSRQGTVSTWTGATPSDPVTYYNPDDSIAVYVFSVVRHQEKEDVGFVTVSAYKSPVVLEFSPSPAPHKLTPDAVPDRGCGSGLSLDTERRVFLGPLLYGYQASDMDENEHVFLSFDGVLTLRLAADELSEMVRAWQRFVEDTMTQSEATGGAAPLAPQASKMLSVTPVRQGCNTIQPCGCPVPCTTCTADATCQTSGRCWVGCHPAAGASIMRYWNDHGYPGLGTSADTIMVALHQYMNTNECGATTRPNSTAGIESYTAAKGHSFDATCTSIHSGCSGTAPTFQQLVDEINADRPVILAYHGHANTGIGYDTNGQIAILNSNLGSDPRYVPWSLIASYTSSDAAGIITIHPAANIPPNPPPLDGPANKQWLASRTVTLSWHDGGDPDNRPLPHRDYYAEVWKTGWSATYGWTTNTSWQVAVPSDGTYSWHVRAGDGAEGSAWSETRVFRVDTAPPGAPVITTDGSGCTGVQSNAWQNSCRDPRFVWEATDSQGSDGSGIASYAYVWSTDPTTDPADWSGATSYDPAPVAEAGGWGQHFLRVRARDGVGNLSPITTFGLWYDGSRPTAAPIVASGAETVHTLRVGVEPRAQDTDSGLDVTRLSNDGLAWHAEPYAVHTTWTLAPLNRQLQTAYLEVEDRVGNRSSRHSCWVCLDLYPAHPSSAGYRLWSAGPIAAGSRSVSSQYHLASTAGQPAMGGDLHGTHYHLRSGFQALWPAQPGVEMFTVFSCRHRIYLPVTLHGK